MSDNISRQAALDVLDDFQSNIELGIDDYAEKRKALCDLPSADRPSGEWIRTFDGNEWYWYCSNCKEQWYEEDLWMGGNKFPHFCPNCGADMRGE